MQLQRLEQPLARAAFGWEQPSTLYLAAGSAASFSYRLALLPRQLPVLQ